MFQIKDTIFYEKINFVKLKYIIDHRSEYENIVDKERDADGCDKKASIWAIMKKMYKKVEKLPFSEYGYIQVKYNKGKFSNDIGRWYVENGTGLAPIKSCIRHTICDDIWLDIDQVNSHPTILKQIMDKYQYSSPLLNNYIENRDDVLNNIMNEEGFSRENAKDAVISIINGKNYKSNTLSTLHNELKLPIVNIMKSKEYIDIYNYCKNTFGDKCNLWGKTMSRILQYEENKMLECYIEFCYDKGLIKKYKDGYETALVFDGFQLMKNNAINDELLEELRLYALEKTGFDIKLKLKPFDKYLNLPENYNLNNQENKDDDDDDDDEYIENDIKSYEETKVEFEKNKCKIMFPPSIYTFEAADKDQMQNFKYAKDTYGDVSCYVIEKKKKKIKKFIYLWLDDPNKRRYKKVVWKPAPLLCDAEHYNTWKPFSILDTEPIKTDRDYYAEFLELAYNLFETKEVANYILARYAFRLQNPGLRTHVLFIYNGEEGAGKSSFIETIYLLFDNFELLDDARKLYDKHSCYEKEKYFICVNDASGNDNHKNCDVLKSRVTEPTLSINPKGVQSYTIDNLCDYDMTTNNTNVVKITDESTRRWFQTETTNYYLGNVKFFEDYRRDIINNKQALRAIYDELIKYDWKAIVPSGNFQDAIYKPKTEITKIVKEANRDKFIWFFNDFVNDCMSDDDITYKISKNDFFKKWKDWCADCNITNIDFNKIQFGIKKQTINKKVKSKTGHDFIIMDSHGYNIIYKNPFLKYMESLNNS